MSLNKRMIEYMSSARMACNGRLIADDISQDFRDEIDELFKTCIHLSKTYTELLKNSTTEIVTTDHIDEIDVIVINIEDSVLDDVEPCFDDLHVFIKDQLDSNPSVEETTTNEIVETDNATDHTDAPEDDSNNIIIEDETHFDIPS